MCEALPADYKGDGSLEASPGASPGASLGASPGASLGDSFNRLAAEDLRVWGTPLALCRVKEPRRSFVAEGIRHRAAVLLIQHAGRL